MPAGFSALDFYFILPEILLTCGALVLLMLSVIVPKRDGVAAGGGADNDRGDAPRRALVRRP